MLLTGLASQAGRAPDSSHLNVIASPLLAALPMQNGIVVLRCRYIGHIDAFCYLW